MKIKGMDITMLILLLEIGYMNLLLQEVYGKYWNWWISTFIEILTGGLIGYYLTARRDIK